MIPDRDYYADKHGKLTTDMSQAAFQVAVAGCVLDPRVAKRYGIGGDVLVAADEPGAVRRVKKGSVTIDTLDESDESPAEEPEAAEAADAASPKAEAKPKQPAAKKGAKKK